MPYLRRTPVLALLFLFLLFPSSVRSQQVVLELDPGVITLSVCDFAHDVASCQRIHIDMLTSSSVGATIRLGGVNYVLDWVGAGYYLDSGLILEPLGETKAGLAGQSWLEVYPKRGTLHSSSAWQDTDGDRRLSVSDALTLENGLIARVKDVRLNLRVSPAKPK
ncbi:MAG TPA: hypothetical protein VF173_18095 [Thermoanaerobaculia bacterium]|nr:hypothetical protein [Thermoanaerobaculia bacterium]